MIGKTKVNKDEFLQKVADNSDIDIKIVNDVYDNIIDTIKYFVCEGKSVSLTRFGTFSLKEHKGHPVQFQNEENSSKSIDNYKVFKFDASDVFIKQIRNESASLEVKWRK